MNTVIRKDILRVLTKAINATKKNYANALVTLSDEVNHNSSIFQDEDSITLAVIVYALSKIITRGNGKVDMQFASLLQKAKQSLLTNNFDKYREIIRDIVRRISHMDSKIQNYILHVYNQSEIKKGSKIFYNGISLPRVSELMGVSQWELMNYIGKTNIVETFERDKRVKARLTYARRLFNL